MMVTREELQQANDLQRESQRIRFELASFDLPGAITSVTWTPTPPEMPDTAHPVPDPVTISTIGLAYPPQMLAAIKEQLQKRYDEIVQQLSDLGVQVDQPEARKAKK